MSGYDIDAKNTIYTRILLDVLIGRQIADPPVYCTLFSFSNSRECGRRRVRPTAAAQMFVGPFENHFSGTVQNNRRVRHLRCCDTGLCSI